MLEIIKECKGKTKWEKEKAKKYIKKCWNCKSIFTYQKEDIRLRYGFSGEVPYQDVICPVCDNYNNIIFKRRYRKKG